MHLSLAYFCTKHIDIVSGCVMTSRSGPLSAKGDSAENPFPLISSTWAGTCGRITRMLPDYELALPSLTALYMYEKTTAV